MKIRRILTAAVENIEKILSVENPQTILLPWRRDPHPDHRATWQIVSAAVKDFDIEKFVCSNIRFGSGKLPKKRICRLQTKSARGGSILRTSSGQKQSAINAHRFAND